MRLVHNDPTHLSSSAYMYVRALYSEMNGCSDGEERRESIGKSTTAMSG